MQVLIVINPEVWYAYWTKSKSCYNWCWNTGSTFSHLLSFLFLFSFLLNCSVLWQLRLKKAHHRGFCLNPLISSLPSHNTREREIVLCCVMLNAKSSSLPLEFPPFRNPRHMKWKWKCNHNNLHFSPYNPQNKNHH